MSKEIQPSRLTHRRAAVMCLALAVLTVVPFTLIGTTLAAVASAVDWNSSATDISGGRSYHPDVAFDSSGHYHSVYTRSGKLYYATDLSGSLKTKSLSTGLTGDKNPQEAIAVRGNDIYIAFNRNADDVQVYYIHGTINGTDVNWDSRVQLSNNGKATAPDVAIDANGNAYVAWSEKNQGCGDYSMALRIIEANGNLSSQRNTPVKDCNAVQARPSLAITNDGVVHMVFSSESDIYYARLVNGSWTGQKKLAGGVNPGLATDGTNLYAVYGKGNVKFRRSTDGGDSWSNELLYGGDGSRADFSAVGWSATAQRAIVAWGDDASNGDNNYDIWTREFVPASGASTAADQLSHSGGAALPQVGAGVNKVGVAYQTNRVLLWLGTASGNGTVPTTTPTTPPVAVCNGTVAIAGGAAYTTSTNVSATISPSTGCVPVKMQYSVDAPITTATAIVDYNATLNLSLTDDDSCKPHTVYVRLYNATQGGNVLSDTIIVDKNVSASVKFQNPFLPGNVVSPTNDGGPNNGDPAYTRNGQVYLSVDDISDCSGIKNFNVTGGTAQTLTNGTYAAIQPLNSQFTQVFVTDNAGNTQTYPSSSQSFNIMTDRDAPTLVGTPVVTGTQTANNILVTLNFSDVVVNDATYTKNAVGKQFWGVWIANSHNPNVQDPAALKWQAVEIPAPNTTFSLRWSLFAGLSSADQNTTQPYYVYVKFMDGAGNITTQQIISNPITLATGFSQPKLSMPLITVK